MKPSAVGYKCKEHCSLACFLVDSFIPGISGRLHNAELQEDEDKLMPTLK